MISVIIPTYNSEKFISNLLDSIFKSGVQGFEVVMVDDCSTDNTVEIAKKYPVKIVELGENSGPAIARNMGVKKAKGDILFFLDSDVVVMKGTINEVKDFFDKNPATNCVIGICTKEPLNKGFVPRYMALFEHIHLAGSDAERVSVFSPRCGAVRKDFFEKIGGYNETYRRADLEDFELARRINKADGIVLNRKMIVTHQFADFKKAVRNYFMRSVLWVHLFIKERQLDNAGPSVPSNGIAAICAFFSFISLVLMPFINIELYSFVFFIIIYFLANLRWLSFMRREAGFIFMVKAIFLNYILGIDITIAAIFALISYPFKKRQEIESFKNL
jgi:glycosyltransferase involved in cell wall biosynthesis